MEVSTAERISTATAAMPSAPQFSAAVASAHLLWKPTKGGMPTSSMPQNRNTAMVKGITRLMPRISPT